MKTLFSLCLCLVSGLVSAQPVQTVRGRLFDVASKVPIMGAAVQVVGSRPLLGAITGVDGRFRLEAVPVGRVRLQLTSVGYEPLLLNEVIVNAGKEVVLELGLTESVTALREVKVSYQRREDRTVANNDMATVSARPFNAAETARYAGSFGDPSRMAANFAGVSGANDARNDIVVRGNSPASLLWRLEGINIPNPNHFGSLGTSGGPVSMLNNNLLAKSDFLTGAFPAEYANALGSVFDVRLRRGNDEKREFLGQMGFNGVEVGAEGPYSRRSRSDDSRATSGRATSGQASYLVNYRYSFFGVLKAVGFEMAGTPQYRDFTFKTDLPVGRRGALSAWVLSGRSHVQFLGKEVATDKPDAYGEENRNTRVRYATDIAALTYEHRFNDRTYGRLTLSGSRAWQQFRGDTVIYRTGKVVEQEIPAEQTDFTQTKRSLNAVVSHKFSARDKLTGGLVLDLIGYVLNNRGLYPVATTLHDADGQTLQTQAYAQWQHRFSDRLTLNTGLSFLRLSLNGSWALEPRAGLSYRLDPISSLNVAYGLHSIAQPILTYFYQTRQADGTYARTNRNLNFTRSHHAVVSYDRLLTETLRLKAEAYYQWLFDAPVERMPSYFSILTHGTNFGPVNWGNLVNRGTGRNYGLELTLEKYFANNYYFLITTSLFESKYRGSDGIERNTPFNNRYVANVLAGREFRLGRRGNVFGLNWRLTTAGGRFTTPINLEQSRVEGRNVSVTELAFSSRQSPYFRTDVRISYKINRARLTHELALDLQNLTNHQNEYQQVFNPRSGRIGTTYQQGFLPIPFYRLTF